MSYDTFKSEIFHRMGATVQIEEGGIVLTFRGTNRVEVTEKQFELAYRDAKKFLLDYYDNVSEEGVLRITREQNNMKYKLPDYVWSVLGVYDEGSQYGTSATSTSGNPLEYLFLDKGMLSNGSLDYYAYASAFYSDLLYMLTVLPNFKFNPTTKNMILLNNTNYKYRQFIYLQVSKSLFEDDEAIEALYQDSIIQRTVMAYMFKQWAQNMMKYEVILVGGRRLRQDEMMTHANEMLIEIREEVKNDQSSQPLPLFG